MNALTLLVPTFTPSARPEDDGKEYSEPNAEIGMSSEEGLRLELRKGTKPEFGWPQIVIERRAHGWMLFLAPNEGDESGYLQFHDDGRMCLIRDKFVPTEIDCPEPGEPGINID